MPAFCCVILLTLQFRGCGFIRLQTVAADEHQGHCPALLNDHACQKTPTVLDLAKSVTRSMHLLWRRRMSLTAQKLLHCSLHVYGKEKTCVLLRVRHTDQAGCLLRIADSSQSGYRRRLLLDLQNPEKARSVAVHALLSRSEAAAIDIWDRCLVCPPLLATPCKTICQPATVISQPLGLRLPSSCSGRSSLSAVYCAVKCVLRPLCPDLYQT